METPQVEGQMKYQRALPCQTVRQLPLFSGCELFPYKPRIRRDFEYRQMHTEKRRRHAHSLSESFS